MLLGRRGFLHTLAAATATVAAFDPDRLIWTPGTRTIFLPPTKQFERVDLIVDPSTYCDIEIDMNEATFGRAMKHGATFNGFDRVTVYNNDGSVRSPNLEQLQGRLLQADAKRANARLNDWTRRRIVED